MNQQFLKLCLAGAIIEKIIILDITQKCIGLSGILAGYRYRLCMKLVGNHPNTFKMLDNACNAKMCGVFLLLIHACKLILKKIYFCKSFVFYCITLKQSQYFRGLFQNFKRYIMINFILKLNISLILFPLVMYLFSFW